jgi:hypothetical protein
MDPSFVAGLPGPPEDLLDHAGGQAGHLVRLVGDPSRLVERRGDELAERNGLAASRGHATPPGLGGDELESKSRASGKPPFQACNGQKMHSAQLALEDISAEGRTTKTSLPDLASLDGIRRQSFHPAARCRDLLITSGSAG